MLDCVWWKKWYSAPGVVAAMGMVMLVISSEVYLYISANNDLIKKRIEIPLLQKSLKELKKENERLQYEINQFESPAHLMQLLHQPEYSHLKPVYQDKVIEIPLPRS